MTEYPARTPQHGWVDADMWRIRLADRGIFFMRVGETGRLPTCPFNYADAEAFAEALGLAYEHQSDGSTLCFVGPELATATTASLAYR